MLSTRNGDECHVIIYISKILSKYIDTLRVKWQVTEYRTFVTSVLAFATHIRWFVRSLRLVRPHL